VSVVYDGRVRRVNSDVEAEREVLGVRQRADDAHGSRGNGRGDGSRFAQEIGLAELEEDVSTELGRRFWPGNPRAEKRDSRLRGAGEPVASRRVGVSDSKVTPRLLSRCLG